MKKIIIAGLFAMPLFCAAQEKTTPIVKKDRADVANVQSIGYIANGKSTDNANTELKFSTIKTGKQRTIVFYYQPLLKLGMERNNTVTLMLDNGSLINLKNLKSFSTQLENMPTAYINIDEQTEAAIKANGITSISFRTIAYNSTYLIAPDKQAAIGEALAKL